MSFFSTALAKYLKSQKQPSSEFSLQTGVSRSSLSRYLSGSLLPEASIMGKILKGVRGPDQAQHRADLLLGYLRDLAPEDYRTRINVSAEQASGLSISEHPSQEYGTRVALSREAQETINYWTLECAKDPTVATHLIWMQQNRERTR